MTIMEVAAGPQMEKQPGVSGATVSSPPVGGHKIWKA